MKEEEDYLNKWREICSWIKKFNIVKIPVFSNEIPVEIPASLFYTDWQKDTKIYMEKHKN